MKKLVLGLIFIFFMAALCFGENKDLLLDDFEGQIYGGPDGTVDFGAGGGSAVDVTASTEIKYSGNQAIKATFDASPGGYMWVARGFGLDAQNAGWLVKPEEINWSEFQAIAFYLYGSNSQAKIAFDIKDKGNEMWRFMLEENFTGWKRIVCSFGDFFVRDDWQPDTAEQNATLDFPIKVFQFEPRPEAKGTLYFDRVELIKK